MPVDPADETELLLLVEELILAETRVLDLGNAGARSAAIDAAFARVNELHMRIEQLRAQTADRGGSE